MTAYKIERWDVVMYGNSITRVPIIYIKPDMPLLEFFRANNYAVACEIQGTGMEYDGRKIAGVVDESCYNPSCRPNFCMETGYYIVSLQSNWMGYPDYENLGTVTFFGFKVPSTSQPPKEKTPSGDSPSAKADTAAASSADKKAGLRFLPNLTMPQWIGVMIACLVLVLIVVFFVTSRGSKSSSRSGTAAQFNGGCRIP